MPRESVTDYLKVEPSMDSVRSIASACATSLTASGFRLIELTTFRAAIVWSQNNKIIWYKASSEFVRWVRKGELDEQTFAFDCFKHRDVPQQLESVPASVGSLQRASSMASGFGSILCPCRAIALSYRCWLCENPLSRMKTRTPQRNPTSILTSLLLGENAGRQKDRSFPPAWRIFSFARSTKY